MISDYKENKDENGHENEKDENSKKENVNLSLDEVYESE